MTTKENKPVLVDEKLALTLFLDSLLREPLETPELEAEIETSIVTAVPLVVPDTSVKEAPAVIKSEPLTATTEESELECAQEEEVAGAASDWSQEFQAMLFKVAGLTLAVPLEGLNGVVEWKDDLAEMPGHADFYLGILQHMGQRIPVVETASLVFPPDKLKSLAIAEPRDRITRIVLIDGGRWGLAVDSVEEVITLEHDQVRWRSERTQRKWLLGTVVEHMCALIDPHAFAEKLISGEE
ncbi:CheW domain protein [hydrothermal vent metagenome]|uniref:CheW domain protein n=1 Tax=hydrothermal vent metagenome TaxID=652676 RepID=A0A3B1BQL8_9ZZZZ